MRYLRWLVWIVGIIVALMVAYAILYFWFLKEKLSLIPQSISEYIPAVSPIPTQGGTQPIPDSAIKQIFYYQGRQVKMVEGNYQKILLGERLLTARIGNQDRVFSLTKDTRAVCQPTGFLNIDTSPGQAIPAEDIFIEDKTGDNSGIPWGVEISPGDIHWKVKPQTRVQLFAEDDPGSIIPIPKLAYIWFETCVKPL